jgi:hypothetical protein
VRLGEVAREIVAQRLGEQVDLGFLQISIPQSSKWSIIPHTPMLVHGMQATAALHTCLSVALTMSVMSS